MGVGEGIVVVVVVVVVVAVVVARSRGCRKRFVFGVCSSFTLTKRLHLLRFAWFACLWFACLCLGYQLD